AMRNSDYTGAHFHFTALVDRSQDPAMKLPWTRKVEQHRAEIDDSLRRLEKEFHVGDLQRFWPGARISRREPGAPGTDADPLDVEEVYDSEGSPPLRAMFLAGFAKKTLTPLGARTVTPGGTPGPSLELLPPSPDYGRETIADRALVLDASPFDVRAPMS